MLEDQLRGPHTHPLPDSRREGGALKGPILPCVSLEICPREKMEKWPRGLEAGMGGHVRGKAHIRKHLSVDISLFPHRQGVLFLWCFHTEPQCLPASQPGEQGLLPCFTDEEMETQRSEVTWPGSHSS